MLENSTMTNIGTSFTSSAKKVLLLGSGELGKEVAIELQRFGCEVVAADSYPNAPAMQVADRAYVFSMLDGKMLKNVVETEKPDLIVPEVEAIATETLLELETEGFKVVPTARATRLTMDREGIRNLAAKELKLRTSPYVFADTRTEFDAALKKIGMPCVIKPVMSSSGKGQSTIKVAADVDKAWQYSQEGGRTGEGRVIVEGFVDFDYEITLLTVRHAGGTSFCQPIGHRQEGGDYQESWQPQAMSESALSAAKDMARKITDALGGYGLFGVELFVKDDKVIFSEVSPRPHDTGMVTMISQDLSEFALHALAILGLPIPNIENHGASASSVITAKGKSENIVYENLDKALSEPNTQIRIFGKPYVNGARRMGVALARGESVQEARDKANQAARAVTIKFR
jgi:phosphoribosylglycinamide formyltransferase 2